MLVVVELVSPTSRRTDHVIKRGEYADAGIARSAVPVARLTLVAEATSAVGCYGP